MPSRRLPRTFFDRPTLTVARDLLGKVITVRTARGKVLQGSINETEAYLGPQDRAAHSHLPPHRAPQAWHHSFEPLLQPHVDDPRRHFESWAASGGKITKRTFVEYLRSGLVYIYMVYGMYWQLNITTRKSGIPECVLIRSVIPIRELPRGGFTVLEGRITEANGPGKLCDYLKLDKSFYAEDATKSARFGIYDWGVKVPKTRVRTGPRIGIDYAGRYFAAKPWRFWFEPAAMVARPNGGFVRQC